MLPRVTIAAPRHDPARVAQVAAALAPRPPARDVRVVASAARPDLLVAAAGDEDWYELCGTAERGLGAGARAVLVTRPAGSAFAFRAVDEAWELVTPRAAPADPDVLVGALAAAWAAGDAWEARLERAAAATVVAALRGVRGLAPAEVDRLRGTVQVAAIAQSPRVRR